MEISITRALVELTTLKKRIDKFNDQIISKDVELISVKQGDKLCRPFSHVGEEDFKKHAVSNLQSIKALFERYSFIKTAIDQSNAITKIKIGEKDITIQEALVLKQTLPLKERYLSSLKSLVKSMRDLFDEKVVELDNRVDDAVKTVAPGKDLKGKELEEAQLKMKEFISTTNKVELVDPCKIDEVIKDLETEISDFKDNIDYALSESNSRTTIIIPD